MAAGRVHVFSQKIEIGGQRIAVAVLDGEQSWLHRQSWA